MDMGKQQLRLFCNLMVVTRLTRELASKSGRPEEVGEEEGACVCDFSSVSP